MKAEYLRSISRYIKAKDNNKPHLMAGVFTQDATLNMQVNSDNISFPNEVFGSDNITKVLVKDFNLSYENIYTLCLSDTIVIENSELSCDWFVAMTDRSTQSARFGYGQYVWQFDGGENALVSKLDIDINEMLNLPIETALPLFTWLQNLDYPWTKTSAVLQQFPDIDSLLSFKKQLNA